MRKLTMEQGIECEFVVHLYADVPTGNPQQAPRDRLDIKTSDLPPLRPEQQHKAETLVQHVCKILEIGATGFYLFGIQALDGEPNSPNQTAPHWIPPNKPLDHSKGKKHFRFRLRYIPTLNGIKVLTSISPKTLDYLFLQCRHDFVNDRIKLSDQYKLEHILGLGVIDKLRWGMEHNVPESVFKKTTPWPFIPSSSNKHFKMIWDKKRLAINFNSKLKDLSNDNGRKPIDHKNRYIYGILTYSQQYGIEEFESELSLVVVDPHHEHGIYIKNKPTDTEEPFEEPFCYIEDVMSMSVNESSYMQHTTSYPWIVTISRKREGHPKTLNFDTKDNALSFITLIDGYHRLIEDFHEQISSDVFSPIIKELSGLKCFGPVSVRWAERKLIEKHNQEKIVNYIMMQDASSLNTFVILSISPTTNRKDSFDHRPMVGKIVVSKNEDNKWKCSHSKDAPRFNTVRQLLEHYRQDKDPYLKLKRYVAPTGQCDRDLYLCRNTTDGAGDERDTVKQSARSQVQLKWRVDHSGSSVVGHGEYTQVSSFLYEKDKKPIRLAIKQLKPIYKQCLQEFTKSMNDLSFWRCPNIVAVHAICLYPFQAVLDFGSYGDLCSYIREHPQSMKHLISTADQVAQALLYLQEYGDQQETTYICHGNIRCNNVFVFDVSEGNGLKVKLGDSGMLELYNQLPMRHKVNEERAPWIAPEVIDSSLLQGDRFQFADIYSFGVFLWELFSGGQRPFRGSDLRQIINKVLYGEGLSPPVDAPNKIQMLSEQCLKKNADQRPSAKDIVRIIRQTQSDVFHNQEPTVDNQYSLPDGGEADLDVWDSTVEAISPLSKAQKDQKVESLMLQSLVSQHNNGAMGFSSPTSSGATLTNSQPQSPINNGDSHTPLIPHSFSGHDESLCTSHASQVTTTTLLDDMPRHHREIAKRPLPAAPRMPLPPVPVATAPVANAGADRLQESMELDPDRVIIGKNSLGSGYYGMVYEGFYKNFTGEDLKVAIKSLKSSDVAQQKEFKAEIDMMTKLSHPNIVQIIGQTSKNDYRVFLVMEFVENGCLQKHLSMSRKKIDEAPSQRKSLLEEWEPRLLRYSREITEAMVFLSNRGIVHRDLAARNVLVTRDDSLKVSDFGLARHLGDKDYYKMSDDKKVMPIFWCSPEAIKMKRFTTKSDVWGLGVTLWETFSMGRKPLILEEAKMKYIMHYLGPKENRRLPQEKLLACPKAMYSDVMMDCWRYEAEDRPDFETVLAKIKAIEEQSKRSTPPTGNT